MKKALFVFFTLCLAAPLHSQEWSVLPKGNISATFTGFDTPQAQTTAGTTITFTVNNSAEVNSTGFCFVSGTDSAVNFTWSSSTYDGSTGVKIWESAGNAVTETALFRYPNLTGSGTASLAFTASEDVATNTGADCFFIREGAQFEIEQAYIAVIETTAATATVTFSVPNVSGGNGYYYCYYTGVGATDRTYTWSNTYGLTVSEGADADVENVTRTHTSAVFSQVIDTANIPNPTVLTLTASGANTTGNGACLWIWAT